MGYAEMAREIRRHLHTNAEISFQEHGTTQYVAERLTSLGLAPIRKTPTGLWADITSERPGPGVLLRCDIDALPIVEETGLPFASKNKGAMHACGHDAHTAMLLVAAERMLREGVVRKGTVRLLFEHAEEQMPGGAREMVAAGVTKGMDMAFAIHVLSSLPLGKAQVGSGPITANYDIVDVAVTGRGGHAGVPQEAVDAAVVAAHFLIAAQMLISRGQDPTDPAVLTFGRIEAGTAANIIPERATLSGTVRTVSERSRSRLEEGIRRVGAAIADAHGARVDISYERGCPGVVNDPHAAAQFRAAAVSVLGGENVEPGVLEMVSEDFSYLLEDMPGVFLNLGSGGPGKDFPHHHPRFDIEEDVLPLGVELWLQLARQLNGSP